MPEVKEIQIERIKVGEYDQRLESSDEGIDGLVSSIGRVGLVYPCVVCRKGDVFFLLEGHRRLAACRRLGKKTVRCSIAAGGKDTEAEIAFAGNFFRKDLSPVELAAALKDCLDQGTMNVKQLAAGFHRSIHWVSSMIAIADWPADVQEAIHNEKISVSAGSNLACVTEPEYRAFLVRNAVESGASARTTSAWLQAWRSMQPQEEAILAEPVNGRLLPQLIVPQAPCFCCAQVFRVNEMSHVPLCGPCVQVLRQIPTAEV